MWQKIKQKQQMLLWVSLGMMVFIVIVAYVALAPSAKNIKKTNKSEKKYITGTSRINPQEAWVHDFTAKAEITQKRIETLEQMLEKLIKMNTSQAMPYKEENKTSVENLRSDIEAAVQMARNGEAKDSIEELPLQPQPLSGTQNLTKPHFKSRALKKISLNLSHTTHHKPLKTVDNTIPAGAFAEAVLLGGVVASTSIQASSDPLPVLLLIGGKGTLPRGFTSDLKGCHALAGAYGDISSGRVLMRLEKLSCVERATGEVIEMDVKGYVTDGVDGAPGVMGKMVDRSGPSMRNAMVGGFFGSIGRFLGQSKNPLLFSPSTGFAQQNPLTTSDILKQSAGNGMSGALDKYAEFYIKRAEQMQPVIHAKAGVIVNIVFSNGFSFSDSVMRKLITKTNDQKRYQQVQSMEDTRKLQEWLPKNEGDAP